MWTITSEPVEGGVRLRFYEGEAPLSFADYLNLLATDGNFASWYTESLTCAGPTAFFWEHPPLTTAGLKRDAECVLVGSQALASLRPDPRPFTSRFDNEPGSDVITFSNLGGDATLIAPRPIGPQDAYPHLAVFLRAGPKDQVMSLWHATALAVSDKVGATPLWLSTSGLGVAWLHIRLDSRPKYYQHAPYKALEAASS